MAVWEVLALDAAGTLVTLGTTAVAAFLLHRAGRLDGVYGKVGGWLAANSAAISSAAEKMLEDLLRHEHVVPAADPQAPTTSPPVRPIPQPGLLQGDAGFHGIRGDGVDPAAVSAGGAGGQPGGVPDGGAGPDLSSPRG